MKHISCSKKHTDCYTELTQFYMKHNLTDCSCRLFYEIRQLL